MRALTGFIFGALAAIGVILLVVFVAYNTQGVMWHFLGYSFTVSGGWIAAGAAILGFLLGFLLLFPGRLASGWRGWSLRRESARREQELASLQAQHTQLQAERERLQAEHQQVVAERDQLRSRLVTTPADGAQPQVAPSAAPGMSPETAPATAPAAPKQAGALANGSPAPDGSTVQQPAPQPSLGERLRDAFSRPQTENPPDQTGTPQGPAVPTA